MNRDRDRRWIILAEDGRFVTLGRAADPTEEEIAQAEVAMRAQGLAGWLAVMEVNRYTSAHLNLLEVRLLAAPTRAFAEAVAAFHQQRCWWSVTMEGSALARSLLLRAAPDSDAASRLPLLRR